MSKKRNLDVYLAEVFKQFIAIKDSDIKRSQNVFRSVFDQVKQRMEEQCHYFKRYGSEVLYAGSVYDGIKVSKMDEFDMNIVIRLPINYSDEGPNGIMLEHDQPGFVRMKITNPFDNLDKQPDWEMCHKVTRDWRDQNKYFLQNKFRQWLHGIVQRALNDMGSRADVDGTEYSVTYKETGPAFTLNIRSKQDEEFVLDVDLVPVIKFRCPRWPKGYREIKNSQVKDWLVVPKPNKAAKTEALRNRGWRLSFQEHEKEMMKDCQAFKTTIRLVKKLRDSLELKGIASYYIKTLFLWEIEHRQDKSYWQNKLSVTFSEMVTKLYMAVKEKSIPFFWHKDNNLLGHLKPTVCAVYADKLKLVVDAINSRDVDRLLSYILTEGELTYFKNTELYQRLSPLPTPTLSQISNESLSESFKTFSYELKGIRDECEETGKADFEKRISDLEKRVSKLEDAMKRLLELSEDASCDQVMVTVVTKSNITRSRSS